jgi:putative peptidoglycan lipid II flippase
VSGVIVGVLNSYEQFSIPALTPVAWNLVIIAGLVIGVPLTDSDTTALYVYAGSILVGTVVQVLLPVPWLYGLDGRLRLALDWRDPLVKRVLVLMLPVTLGLGLINFNQVIGTIFAARLIDPTLAPAAIDAAFRIYMLPQGIFSVAVATVLFPSLSRLSTREDWNGFRGAVSLGLRQIAFLLLPASALCAVLAEPMVRLLYQRGEFGPDQTTVVAGALAAFSLGLTFNGFMLMLNRAFFSLQRPWTPTLVALGNLGLNTALYFAFYRVGTWGIPLAISIANVAASAALFVLLRRRLGRMDFGAIASSFLRVAVASTVMAAVAYGVWRGLDEVLGRGVAMQAISLLTALFIAAVVYLLTARVLRVRELEALLALRRRRGAP